MMFLVALRQDLVRRCAELGIQFAVWDETAMTDEQRIIGCPLVFVAVETAVGTFFHTFLARLDAAQRLDRVILDEAHLVTVARTYGNLPVISLK
jgi:superfamily II DNA helicase RecQ